MSIEWDFSRLPESEYPRVIEAVRLGDTRTLYEIHNTYKLSGYEYCCDQEGLKIWFSDAIKNGIIK